MTYLCRCEDGPARGTEFREYCPSVKVDLPHEGQTLIYRLTDIKDTECVYQFVGCREKGGDRSGWNTGSGKSG